VATGDLTTKEDVKASAQGVGLPGDRDRPRIVTAASEFIRTVTSWPFGMGSQTYSEIRSGSGGRELYLANPVSTVTSLVVNAGTPIPAQPANGQWGWFLDGQVLCLEGYCFTRGRKNVRITYSGDAGLPKDLAQACVEIVASACRRGKRGPELQSESSEVGRVTTAFSMADCPAFAKTIIERYTQVVSP
jgi:hypothetical protein